MLGNTASTGYNLKLGLEKQGHTVKLLGNFHPYLEGKYDHGLFWKDIGKKFLDFKPDIVHSMDTNVKTFGILLRYIKGAKFVCHWHGSDLRLAYRELTKYVFFPWLFKFADYHLYSSRDLAWWLRSIPFSKKMFFICPVDVNMFKSFIPYNKRENDLLIIDNDSKFGIPHNEMPMIYNKYRRVFCYPSYGLSPYLYSVTEFEAGACGCKVPHHPEINRKWVISNASIESQTKKLLRVYNSLFDGGM